MSKARSFIYGLHCIPPFARFYFSFALALLMVLAQSWQTAEKSRDDVDVHHP